MLNFLEMKQDNGKRMIVAIGCAFIAVGISIPVSMIASRLEPPVTEPVPLGTNELKVGAKLFNPHGSNQLLWTVTEIDPDYIFPDEEMKFGVKLKSTNGSFWAPREKLNKVLVVQ